MTLNTNKQTKHKEIDSKMYCVATGNDSISAPDHIPILLQHGGEREWLLHKWHPLPILFVLVDPVLLLHCDLGVHVTELQVLSDKPLHRFEGATESLSEYRSGISLKPETNYFLPRRFGDRSLFPLQCWMQWMWHRLIVDDGMPPIPKAMISVAATSRASS